MAKTKKQLLQDAKELINELEVMGADMAEVDTIADMVNDEATNKELTDLIVILDGLKTAQDQETVDLAPVWMASYGEEDILVTARSFPEACNDICEIKPIFKAIGVHPEQMRTNEGFDIVAVVPPGHVFGDQRRG